MPLSYWINPAERLVQAALNKWRMRLMKADNTSAIVVLIDPLGPRKLSILKKRREERMKEVAEKRLSNKSVTDILAANETLQKTSPKKVKDKAVISSVQMKPKPVILDTCKTVKEPASVKHGHAVPCKTGVNLDDSIQLRNGHIASPLPKNNDIKQPNKSTSVSCKNKSPASPTNSCDETSVSTRMATRQSPQKSPLGHTSVSNSQSSVTHTTNKPHASMQPKSTSHGPSSQSEQNCLKPSKCTLDNIHVKNSVASKLQTGVKVKDLENIYSSVVQFSKGHLNLRTNMKSKASRSETLTGNHIEGVRSTKKPHSTKSLSTRISLRLRRLRQKTQKVRTGQGENKGFMVKPGVKRKLDSGHSSATPASKKVKHS